MSRSRLMGDLSDGSGKSSESRQRSVSKVVRESSAFGLESRQRVVSVRSRKSSESRQRSVSKVVTGLRRANFAVLAILNYQPSLRARNFPPGEIADSVECQAEPTCTTTL